jgi:hypothetical protein
MAEEIYGPAFEIHGGGLDLVFPHHENEVAQSRSVGHPFATIWAHNGMLRFTGEKMSKSTGNVMTIREAIDEWGREALLLFFLTASWRKPIDFSEGTMEQAVARRETIRNAFTRPAAALDGQGWAIAAALEGRLRRRLRWQVLHDWAASGLSRCAAGRDLRFAELADRTRRWRSAAPAERRARRGRAVTETSTVCATKGCARLRDARLETGSLTVRDPELVYGHPRRWRPARGGEGAEVWGHRSGPWAETTLRAQPAKAGATRGARPSRDHQGVWRVEASGCEAGTQSCRGGATPRADRSRIPATRAVARSADGRRRDRAVVPMGRRSSLRCRARPAETVDTRRSPP